MMRWMCIFLIFQLGHLPTCFASPVPYRWDHVVFFAGCLEDQSNALPGLEGGRLHDVMRLADVERIDFAILYKGANFRDYQTNCVIERVNWKGNGLTVRATSQEEGTSAS
jgi:hypothetical protein